VDVVSRALALVDASQQDVTAEWDARWHIGPIEDRSAGERESALDWLREHRAELDRLDSRLADEASRETLVRLLAHRVAGSRRISLGAGRERAERLTGFASSALEAEPDSDGPLAGYPRYDLEPIGLELRLVAAPMFAVHTFLLEQYRHPTIPEANVRAGDVAVDGGAFWGDTSLWLAGQVGPTGSVVAFEPDPAHLPVLAANLAANPGPAARIEVRAEALWSSDARLGLTQLGAASVVAPGGDGVRAVSLDGLRRDDALGRVDFVKLDVEGTELEALRGASGLIRNEPPRLAVAVYHRPDDLVAIPQLLAELQPRYRFALTHPSLHQFDTVLFAWA
jgi:FkbM family methyltransferase